MGRRVSLPKCDNSMNLTMRLYLWRASRVARRCVEMKKVGGAVRSNSVLRSDVTKAYVGISLIRVRRFNDEIRKCKRRIFISAHLGGGGPETILLRSFPADGCCGPQSKRLR